MESRTAGRIGDLHAFTHLYPGIVNILKTTVGVGEPQDLPNDTSPPGHQFEAVWDTGATHSAISEKVVRVLGLKPLRQERVLTVAGERWANVYLVNLYLPNRVGIIGLPVTDAVLTDEDVLIGMDVISLGDFSISNTEGQTCLSFQYPAQLRIDFVDFYKEASARLRKDSKAQP